MDSAACHLLQLPEELQILIVKCVPTKERKVLRRCCAHLRQLVDATWRRVSDHDLSGIDPPSFRTLPKLCPNLEQLEFRTSRPRRRKGAPSLPSFWPMLQNHHNWPHLRRVYVRENVRIEGLRLLALHRPQLTHLHIPFPTSQIKHEHEALALLPCFSALQDLALTDWEVQLGTEVHVLAQLTTLTNLSLGGTVHCEALPKLMPLTGMSALARLELGSVDVFELNDGLSWDDEEPGTGVLGHLTQLRELSLNVTRRWVPLVGALAGLTNLTRLEVWHSYEVDEELDIGDDPLLDIPPLGCLVALRRLKIHADMCPNGMRTLAGLPQLRSLYVRNFYTAAYATTANIPDLASLEELGAMHYKLEGDSDPDTAGYGEQRVDCCLMNALRHMPKLSRVWCAHSRCPQVEAALKQRPRKESLAKTVALEAAAH